MFNKKNLMFQTMFKTLKKVFIINFKYLMEYCLLTLFRVVCGNVDVDKVYKNKMAWTGSKYSLRWKSRRASKL